MDIIDWFKIFHYHLILTPSLTLAVLTAIFYVWHAPSSFCCLPSLPAHTPLEPSSLLPHHLAFFSLYLHLALPFPAFVYFLPCHLLTPCAPFSPVSPFRLLPPSATFCIYHHRPPPTPPATHSLCLPPLSCYLSLNIGW